MTFSTPTEDTNTAPKYTAQYDSPDGTHSLRIELANGFPWTDAELDGLFQDFVDTMANSQQWHLASAMKEPDVRSYCTPTQ